MKNYAIILASGTGERCGLNIPKQFYKINNKTVLEYSIDAFEKNENIYGIVIVSNPNFIDLTREIVEKNNYKKIINIISGGKTRQESSYIGVNYILDNNSRVLIHDAVRPFVSQDIINNCINALKSHKGVNVAIDSSDTIVQIDNENIIKSVPNRKYLKRCQTPQCFDISIIKEAHKLALNDTNFAPTDDCGLVLRYNLTDIFVVQGSEHNIKITYPSDIKLAESILKVL